MCVGGRGGGDYPPGLALQPCGMQGEGLAWHGPHAIPVVFIRAGVPPRVLQMGMVEPQYGHVQAARDMCVCLGCFLGH